MSGIGGYIRTLIGREPTGAVAVCHACAREYAVADAAGVSGFIILLGRSAYSYTSGMACPSCGGEVSYYDSQAAYMERVKVHAARAQAEEAECVRLRAENARLTARVKWLESQLARAQAQLRQTE